MCLVMSRIWVKIRVRLTRCASIVPTRGMFRVLYSQRGKAGGKTNIDISQFFHTDNGDLVGLLCIHKALEGGESDIVSTHNVFNTLQNERPDVARTLTEPIWYFDRKGETSKGQDEYIRTSIFYLERGEDGRVYNKWAIPLCAVYIGKCKRLMWCITDGTHTMLAHSADFRTRVLSRRCLLNS